MSVLPTPANVDFDWAHIVLQFLVLRCHVELCDPFPPLASCVKASSHSHSRAFHCYLLDSILTGQ